MKPLWIPDPSLTAATQMTQFQQLAEKSVNCTFNNYAALHRWSIEHPADFWSQVWDYCDIIASTPAQTVLENPAAMPGANWFNGSRLNFAENLLRFNDDQVALVGLLENGERRRFTYIELNQQVAMLASALREQGIQPGDRVVGLMPNVPETVIAMLAATSIGAIWSSCSPDFGVNAACDRFGQIEPRLMFTTDAYIYNGREIDCIDKADAIHQRIDSIETVIVFPLINPIAVLPSGFISANRFTEWSNDHEPGFEQLPFDHPLYIMYSSGTTGVPKCIVHGAGGTLLQHLKEHKLHVDLRRDDTLFYFTTCGWMMWNWLVSGLASGATLLLYDGSPFTNTGNILLDAIDDEGITVFGTSAKYLSAIEKQGLVPGQSHSLSTLRTILSTGSPLSHSSFEYVYRNIKEDVHLASISGGTDIISCFILGNPNLPVYAGEIQCAGLGMATDFMEGELVCTRPFPSMPVGFWKDENNAKYHAAYFDQRPGMWTHGDYGEPTSHGGFIIHGRSDAVLNPAGVRIGTAEIYRQVETIPEVVDAIVVGQRWEDDERVILFVVLQENLKLDAGLTSQIKNTIRENTSPRHVPALVLQVPDIPRTVSGKIVEIAVRKVIHGEKVENMDALANPEALDWFRHRSELA